METIFGNHFTPFYYTLFSLYNILIYNNIERKNKYSKHALFALVSKVSKNIRSLKRVYRGSEGLRQSRTLRGLFLSGIGLRPMAFFRQPEAATANSFKTAKGGGKPQNYFKISNLQK
ncbi:hypothetical protein [Capnocytophaga granulosa]|uniref:hypothetical protein n=1 Tax=Capnocytophaga granulosa TaxID=45242 RepID=UPI0028EFC51A|nr:hypothetical protein [Capnocytophaga granulosa]